MKSELSDLFTTSKTPRLGQILHSIFIRSHAWRNQFQILLCLGIRKELLKAQLSLCCLRLGLVGLLAFCIRLLSCNALRCQRFFIGAGKARLIFRFCPFLLLRKVGRSVLRYLRRFHHEGDILFCYLTFILCLVRCLLSFLLSFLRMEPH